jgi:hypothetical protein
MYTCTVNIIQYYFYYSKFSSSKNSNQLNLQISFIY